MRGYHVIPSRPKRQRPERPSPRECQSKLTEVRGLIAEGKWRPAEAKKLQADFDKLADRFGVQTTTLEDQKELLLRAAQEAAPGDYKGGHPPHKAYEATIKDKELFAFILVQIGSAVVSAAGKKKAESL
jgi:hypothetical protein